MLAQNFKTAADLGLADDEHSALIKTLALMDGGKLTHVHPDWLGRYEERGFTGNFNMGWWEAGHTCGTAYCIGGTAEIVGNVEFPLCAEQSIGLRNLFYPFGTAMERITVEQAAIALRSYLTTGDARWDLALA